MDVLSVECELNETDLRQSALKGFFEHHDENNPAPWSQLIS